MKAEQVLAELLQVIFEEEIAGHIPHDLLTRAERIVRPIRCTVCGSSNVQLVMWVRPNTDEIVDDFGSWNETDTKWCDDCAQRLAAEGGDENDAHVLLTTENPEEGEQPPDPSDEDEMEFNEVD